MSRSRAAVGGVGDVRFLALGLPPVRVTSRAPTSLTAIADSQQPVWTCVRASDEARGACIGREEQREAAAARPQPRGGARTHMSAADIISHRRRRRESSECGFVSQGENVIKPPPPPPPPLPRAWTLLRRRPRDATACPSCTLAGPAAGPLFSPRPKAPSGASVGHSAGLLASLRGDR